MVRLARTRHRRPHGLPRPSYPSPPPTWSASPARAVTADHPAEPSRESTAAATRAVGLLGPKRFRQEPAGPHRLATPPALPDNPPCFHFSARAPALATSLVIGTTEEMAGDNFVVGAWKLEMTAPTVVGLVPSRAAYANRAQDDTAEPRVTVSTSTRHRWDRGSPTQVS